MTNLICAQLSAAVLACAFTFSVAAYPQDARARSCSFQPLVIPAPPDFGTIPVGFNDLDAIVGIHNTQRGSLGFLSFRGKFTTFQFPGALFTDPMDINNHGVIVGFAVPPVGNGFAFIVHSGGFQKVEIPGFPDAFATGNGINDHNDIVGIPPLKSGSNSGYLLRKKKLTLLQFPGAAATVPVSVNNKDVVVGTFRWFSSDVDHGFIWKDGHFTEILTPDHLPTMPAKITNDDIVGAYIDVHQQLHGFALSGGKFTTIDTPGSSGTAIISANDRDQVIGSQSPAPPSTEFFFQGNCSKVF